MTTNLTYSRISRKTSVTGAQRVRGEWCEMGFEREQRKQHERHCGKLLGFEEVIELENSGIINTINIISCQPYQYILQIYYILKKFVDFSGVGPKHDKKDHIHEKMLSEFQTRHSHSLFRLDSFATWVGNLPLKSLGYCPNIVSLFTFFLRSDLESG